MTKRELRSPSGHSAQRDRRVEDVLDPVDHDRPFLTNGLRVTREVMRGSSVIPPQVTVA
jgi:hypothetical protein